MIIIIYFVELNLHLIIYNESFQKKTKKKEKKII